MLHLFVLICILQNKEKNSEGENQTRSKINMAKTFSEFNNLVKSMKKEEFKYGSRVEYLDLITYKDNRFHDQGFFDIKYFRKSRIYRLTFRKQAITKNTPSRTKCKMN